MAAKKMWALGLVLALPIACSADGVILKRIHAHGGDCQADKQIVRVPAQDIHIVTARPRVVVGESAVRTRGFYHAPLFAPVASGPFVATFMPANFGGPQTTVGNSALDAAHALERHHLEFARQKASLQAEMDHVDKAFRRIQVGVTSSGQGGGSMSDAAQLQKALEDLTRRVSDIERLLIIHDNILKEKTEKK